MEADRLEYLRQRGAQWSGDMIRALAQSQTKMAKTQAELAMTHAELAQTQNLQMLMTLTQMDSGNMVADTLKFYERLKYEFNI